jgi:DNA-binding CsgD family transcriptional regulator/PAS domain-containing protein
LYAPQSIKKIVSRMSDASNPDLSDCTGLSSAIGEIYAAIEAPALWPEVLRRMADLVNADSTWLVANYVDSNASDIRAFSVADPAMLAEYSKHYVSVNVWAERMDRLFQPGTVGYSHRAITDYELHKTEFYAGWLRPHKLGYCMGTIVEVPNQPPALLPSIRSPQRGPFDEREGRIYEALIPHIQRALRLHGELAILRTSNQGLERALDAFDRAAVGLSGNGDILFCNQTACQLFDDADVLSVKENRLIATVPAQDTRLQYLLRQCTKSGTGFSESGAVLIERRSGKPALRLTLMPFASNLLGHVPGLAVLVFMDDPARKPQSRATILRKLFRLSPVEARLSDLLAGGVELTAAAEQLQMSTQTARFHLKSIFRKTGLNRQVDLARLVLSLPS